jgi:hypothetical protein
MWASCNSCETCVAHPLKDGREAFGWALVFGPVDADANDVCVRMCEEVVEHAIGHSDAELAIDRRKSRALTAKSRCAAVMPSTSPSSCVRYATPCG